jgi:outer membrane protein assembly factor BamB
MSYPALRHVASTLAAISIVAAWACAEDWPRWRGPRGDGTWQAPKLPQRWPDGGPKVVWKQAVGGGYAGVSVADDRVVTMDRRTQPAEVERVVALDAATGKPLWDYAYKVKYGELDHGNGPRAAPTIHGDRVYTLGATGHFCCLDAATGKVFWDKDLAAEEKANMPTWGFSASPLLWNDLVIVHVGARPNGCLLAYDRQNGKLVWRGGDDPAGYATPVVIDAPSGPQLVCWTPQHVVGFEPRTGKVHWKVPYKVTYDVSIATPIYQEGLVFVAGYWEGSKAIRLGRSPAEAELAWEDARELRGLMSAPLYKDGYVYLLDKGNGLTCFELKTGKKSWDDAHKLTPHGRNPQASLVWLGDRDRAIALNSEGELILCRLSPKGYQEDSRAKIIGTTWAHPAYAGRHCYARSDSEIVCVELCAASH